MNLPNILKLWTWLKKAEPAKEPEPEAKAESTTDLSRERSRRAGKINQWIAQNMFQKTHDDIKAIALDGKAIAMDSAVAMDAADIKSAYSLSSGNLPQILFSWYVQLLQGCKRRRAQWRKTVHPGTQAGRRALYARQCRIINRASLRN